MKKKTKRFMVGGPVGGEVNITGTNPAMPSQANMGGALRGLDRASVMSGRDFTGVGQQDPVVRGLDRAALSSGRDMTGLGLRPTVPLTGGPLPPAGMKKGGSVKKMAAGGAAGNHGQPTRPGRTTGMGQPMKYKKGGAVSASKRADGCATKGKTKGKMV